MITSTGTSRWVILRPAVVSTARIWSGVSSFLDILRASTLSCGARLIVCRHPFLGKCRRGLKHFGQWQALLGYGLRQGPPLKRPCAIHVQLVARPTNIIDLNQVDPVDGPHFGRLWCQMHGFDRACLISGPNTLSLWRPSLQVLTLFGGVRFFAWCLRRLFLGECWQGLMHLWSSRARLGYGPAPGPTLKSYWATLVRLVRRPTNTVDFISWIQLIRHTSADSGVSGTGLVWCVWAYLVP